MSSANEKFLERGLGRSAFPKRSSPDYFFESELVSEHHHSSVGAEGKPDHSIAHIREGSGRGWSIVGAPCRSPV